MITVHLITCYPEEHNGRDLVFDTFMVYAPHLGATFVGRVLDYMDEDRIATKMEECMLAGMFDASEDKSLFIILNCLFYICRYHDGYDTDRVEPLLKKMWKHAQVIVKDYEPVVEWNTIE